MRWQKRGLVYVPDGSVGWAKSHAMLPTPWLIDGGPLRVFIGCCDGDMVGRIGFVDLDPTEPTRVLRISDKPVLDIGVDGAFDDSGVIPSCVIQRDDKVWLYYVGFQRGVRVRYFMFSGLAVSEDGGETFARFSEAPVLDRVDGEIVARTAPYVRRGGGGWRIWYVGGDRFIEVRHKQVPTYTLRSLQSADGASWRGTGRSLFGFGSVDEYGFGRPWILDTGSGYQMWYSIRSVNLGYRLGFATSADGEVWRRRDHEVGLDVSESGWDADMICYASVVVTDRNAFLFYNGNDYGRTGFGVAIAPAADLAATDSRRDHDA